jgi:hypothetical protein
LLALAKDFSVIGKRSFHLLAFVIALTKKARH